MALQQPLYILERRQHQTIQSILLQSQFHEAQNLLHDVVKLLKQHHAQIILDVGCGIGLSSLYLAQRLQNHSIFACDVDKKAVALANNTAKYLHLKNLQFLVASAQYLPIRSHSIRFILCQEVIEHIPKPIDLVTESYRILTNQGNMLLTTPIDAFPPFSIDWLQKRLRHRLIADEFASHLYRFVPDDLSRLIRSVGFTLYREKFTAQYFGSFATFIWVSLRKRGMRDTHSCGESHKISRITNMLLHNVEAKLLGQLPFGSNIAIFASKLN